MPGVDTAPEPAEDGLQTFVDTLRAAVGRMQDDAAIAVELNPESLALDDVHLVRDVIVAYAEKLMQCEAIAKEIRTLCFDDDAWEDVAEKRKQIFNMLSPMLE